MLPFGGLYDFGGHISIYFFEQVLIKSGNSLLKRRLEVKDTSVRFSQTFTETSRIYVSEVTEGEFREERGLNWNINSCSNQIMAIRK